MSGALLRNYLKFCCSFENVFWLMNEKLPFILVCWHSKFLFEIFGVSTSENTVFLILRGLPKNTALCWIFHFGSCATHTLNMTQSYQFIPTWQCNKMHMSLDCFPHSPNKLQHFFVCQVFRTRTPPEAIDLVSRLLEYTPGSRISPLQACAHTFFNELREPNTRLPNGRDLPPLFNFTEQGKTP